MPIARIASETYDAEAGQGIGVWGRALTPEEIAQAMKIRVIEVNVYGEPPIGPGGLTIEPLINLFRPSRGFPGSSGVRTAVYEDGPTYLYLARFDGDSHALVGRTRPFADKSVVMKIGVSNEPNQRIEEARPPVPRF